MQILQICCTIVGVQILNYRIYGSNQTLIYT